jgi:methanogenic corrinoid protein MtbC1
MPDMPWCDRLEQALLQLNKSRIRELVGESGLTPVRFAEEVMAPVLDRIGAKWEQGVLSLSQVYMSGRACEQLLDDLLPLPPPDTTHPPKLAVVVFEDFHPLGKRILCSIIRAGGYHFLDYGQLGLEELVQRLRLDGIKILLVSTLMLSSALRVRALRERCRELGLDVKVIVGGAPFRLDPQLWREVGADASSPTASGVIPLLQKIMGDTRQNEHIPPPPAGGG